MFQKHNQWLYWLSGYTDHTNVLVTAIFKKYKSTITSNVCWYEKDLLLLIILICSCIILIGNNCVINITGNLTWQIQWVLHRKEPIWLHVNLKQPFLAMSNGGSLCHWKERILSTRSSCPEMVRAQTIIA